MIFSWDFRWFSIDFRLSIYLLLFSLVLELEETIFDCIFSTIDLFLLRQYSEFTYEMLLPRSYAFETLLLKGYFFMTFMIFILDPFFDPVDEILDFWGDKNELTDGIIILGLFKDEEDMFDWCLTNYWDCSKMDFWANY